MTMIHRDKICWLKKGLAFSPSLNEEKLQQMDFLRRDPSGLSLFPLLFNLFR